MKKVADNSAELSAAISSCNAHTGYMQAKKIPNRVIGTKVTPISAKLLLFKELGFPSKSSRASLHHTSCCAQDTVMFMPRHAAPHMSLWSVKHYNNSAFPPTTMTNN